MGNEKKEREKHKGNYIQRHHDRGSTDEAHIERGEREIDAERDGNPEKLSRRERCPLPKCTHRENAQK